MTAALPSMIVSSVWFRPEEVILNEFFVYILEYVFYQCTKFSVPLKINKKLINV